MRFISKKRVLLKSGLLAAILMSAMTACRTLPVSSKAVQLAAGGKAEAVIVIPEAHSPPVKFAAEELQLYLGKITGAGFKVVHTIPQTGPAVILGEEFAKQAGITIDKIKRDGYAIKTIGTRIYIAGKDDDNQRSRILFTVKNGPLPDINDGNARYAAISDVSWDFERGTLHGAYEFLEHLGVRWFFAGEKGEVVPSQANLAVKPLNLVKEPYFELRVNGRIVFPHRNYKGMFDPEEFKHLGLTLRNQRLWLVRNRSSSKWMAFNHRPTRHQWRSRFGQTHPEYFALLSDGQRDNTPKKRYHLNYTSDGMLKETVADMDAFFSGKKPESRGIKSLEKFELNNGWAPNASYGDSFTLLPNDGLRVDHSPKSEKYLREDKALPFRHTNYVWQFVDKAARELKKIHPDKKITCLAYQAYWEVPEPDVVKKLPDNVLVGIAALSGASRVPTFLQKNRRDEYLDLLKRWSKMSDAPMFFWTYWLYRYKQAGHKGVPLLLPHYAQTFIKAHAQYGKWMFMQHDWMNFTFEHLNRYVVFRLLWDPDADVDAIVDDYCDKLYGPAGPAIKIMLADIEKHCQNNAETNADFVSIWDQAFSAPVMKEYRAQIDEAKKLAAGTPHIQAVDLMDKYFIGVMEEARKDYADNVQKLRDKGKDILKSFLCNPRNIVVDGKRDEHAWKVIGGKPFYNNVNGRPIRPVAQHRLRYSNQAVYFIFDIPDPEARANLANSKKDYIEIFFDVNKDRYTYYWLLVYANGDTIERDYPGPGEPPLDWDSKADVKVKVTDEGWMVEVAVPLASLKLDGKNLEDIQIGALCCVTKMDSVHAKKNDRFSTSNPILRGGFHNPGLFNRLQFVDPKKIKRKK